MASYWGFYCDSLNHCSRVISVPQTRIFLGRVAVVYWYTGPRDRLGAGRDAIPCRPLYLYSTDRVVHNSCLGDRIFAQTQDHEMAFCIPENKIGEIMEGLEGTHKTGVRYPIPSFLRYTGEFPPQYDKVSD